MSQADDLTQTARTLVGGERSRVMAGRPPTGRHGITTKFGRGEDHRMTTTRGHAREQAVELPADIKGRAGSVLPASVSSRFQGSSRPTASRGRGRAIGRTVVMGVVSVVAIVLAVALASASAHAAPKSVNGFFGGMAGGAGGVGVGFGGGAGEFIQPRDVAVYEGVDGDPATDKLFTVEAQGNNMRVQRLDAFGNFELMWGKDVDSSNPGTGFEVCTVAANCRAPSSAGTGSLKGEFSNPMGVAVDQQNGWVYVYDRDNRRIQKFDTAGNFVLMFGKGVNVTTGGDVCTQASGDTCGIGSAGAAAGQLASATQQVRGLAVHPSSGDVFVADPGNGSTGGRRVLQYQADGTFVRGWGFGVDTGAAQFQVCSTTSTCQAGNAAGLGNGQFSNNGPLGLAVDSQGVVYATDAASSTSANRILRFDSDLAPTAPGPPFPDATAALLGQINPTTAAGPLLAPVASPGPNDLAIDADSDGAGPDQESLLAVRDPSTPTTADTVIQELDIPTEPGELPADAVTVADTHNFIPFSVANNGFAVNSTTGQIAYTSSGLSANPVLLSYFSACDCFDTSIDLGATSVAGVFMLSGSSSMDAEIGTPANPTSDSVQLEGTIDPGMFVRYRFQISIDGASWTNVGPVRYAGGSQPTDVSQTVTGLEPNALYRVRLSLRRVTGVTTAQTLISNEGLVLTDAVAPTVETLGSAHRTSTTAQLRALVDPNGSPTSYRFEYGPDGGSFSSHIPIPNAPAGSANTADLITQELTGLIPDTAYHYRVVAANASGTSTGAPVSFATDAIVDSQDPLGDRAYELVSPADKVGGSGVGLWGGGTLGAAVGTGEAAYRGERFAVFGHLGSVLLDGATAYGSDWAFAERTAGGWISRSPVAHAPSNDQGFKVLGVGGASEDLSRVLWGANGGLLRAFPELAGWPSLSAQFVGDWDGRWEILAPTSLDQLYATNNDEVTKPVVSGDGSSVVFTTGHAAGKAIIGGLAGPGDPAHPAWPDLLAGRMAYLDDVSAGLSDEFDGNGVYGNVGVCSDATVLPRRTALGVLEDRLCPAPLAGRDARLVSERGAVVHAGGGSDNGNSITNVVSADGSRVFFLSPDPLAAGVPGAGCTGTDDSTVCAPQLFVRQRNDDGSVATRWISRAEGGLFGNQDAGLTGPVRFAGASPDGDKVYFQTTSPLTADDPNGTGVPAPPGGVTTGTASNSSWDLYMYDLPDGQEPAGGTLTRVSAGPTGNADCNVVVAHPTDPALQGDGALRFVSDDGARSYFTCQAPLPGVALPANGTITSPAGTAASTDATNLYSYNAEAPDGSWTFVARLPRVGTVQSCATRGTRRASLLADATSSSEIRLTPGANCVGGAADGSFVTFWTTARLTLDDPDSVSVDGYAYDADADELTRITAPQGGVGGSYQCGSNAEAATVTCHGDSGLGITAVPRLGVATSPSNGSDRVAFFQTRSRLVPADVDDAYDVYQWRNGELDLLSTGDSPGGGEFNENGGAFYAGNDASGRNVYIATNDRLSWQDVDGVMDVYTARVGGGISQPPLPAVCGVLAGGCQGGGGGTVSAPTTTSTTSGGGDAKPGARATLSVAAVGRRARARAARTGVLALGVRASETGRVSVVARGRVSGRTRVLGRASKQAVGGGVTRIAVRLNGVARRALRSGRALSLAVRVRQAGVRSRSMTVRLERGSRS